jgi:predicted amidophosphoribosyltransferase
MECPNCHQKISGKECSSCNKEIPEESLYCMYCGADLEMKVASSRDEEDFDFENRILCPDGTCTGIIVDGKCTECGKTV